MNAKAITYQLTWEKLQVCIAISEQDGLDEERLSTFTQAIARKGEFNAMTASYPKRKARESLIRVAILRKNLIFISVHQSQGGPGGGLEEMKS